MSKINGPLQYDPCVDYEVERHWYKHGIIQNPLESVKTYDAIIVAVGHKQFKRYTTSDYETLSKGVMLVVDVKNIVENPTWRL